MDTTTNRNLLKKDIGGKSTMIKKILTMITVFACIFSLAGCGEEEKTEKESSVAESVEDKVENSDEEETEESEDNKTAEIESDVQSGYATPEEAVMGIENFLAMKDVSAYTKMIDEETRKKFEEEVGASEKEITEAYKYCAETGNHDVYTSTTLVEAHAFGTAEEALEIDKYAAEYEAYLSEIEKTGAEDTYLEEMNANLEEMKKNIKDEIPEAEDVMFVHTVDDTGTSIQTGMYYSYSVQGRWYVYVSVVTENMLSIVEELLANASK